MPLFDTQCLNTFCGNKEERLMKAGSIPPKCSKCGYPIKVNPSHIFGFGFSKNGGNYKDTMAVPKR